MLSDASLWTTWLRTIGTSATLDSTVGYRRTTAVLRPSAGDTPVTASQDRELSTLTALARYTRHRGASVVRAGAEIRSFPVAEHFTMGLTSPAFNAPGSDGYNAALLPFDLTRGGVPFVFDAARTGIHAGAFAEWRLSAGALSTTLGLRHDE